MVENKKIKGVGLKVTFILVVTFYINLMIIMFRESNLLIEELKMISLILLLVLDFFIFIYIISLVKSNKKRFRFSENDLRKMVSTLPCPNYEEIVREEIKKNDKEIKMVDAKEEIDHQLDTALELASMNMEVDLSKLEDANDEVNSLISSSEWDFTSTFNEIAEKLNDILLTKGYRIERKSIVTFLSAMSTTKVIFLDGDSLVSSLFIEAFNIFIASSMTYTEIKPKFHHPIDLYFEARDNKRYKSEFIKSLYYASDNKDGIHFAVLNDVYLPRAEEYLAELLPIFDNPVEKHTILLRTKDKNIKLDFSTNLWIIGILKDNSSFVSNRILMKNSCVVKIKGELCEKEDIDLEETQMLSFGHFNELIRINREEFLLSEETWKKIDDLSDFLKTKERVALGNKEYCLIEDYISTYASMGYSLEEALDSVLALRILPFILSNNLEEERRHELLEILDKILGVDNNILSSKLLK